MHLKRYIFCLIILVSVFGGCSSISHNKVLSFFFDGVSDPNYKELNAVNDSLSQLDSTGIAEVTERVPKPQFTYHPPYRDKECSSCHDKSSMGKFRKPQPGLCYTCHRNFNETYDFLHGPVAAGYCASCHNQHLSKSDKLLLYKDRQLCFHCHNETIVITNKFHEKIEDANCTKCHDPHGGESRFIVKPGVCNECHENFNKTYDYIHGPVAGGYCTSCHGPHKSKSEILLLRSGQQLCLHCHNVILVFKNEIHSNTKDAKCTECHNPHGGTDKSILK